MAGLRDSLINNFSIEGLVALGGAIIAFISAIIAWRNKREILLEKKAAVKAREEAVESMKQSANYLAEIEKYYKNVNLKLDRENKADENYSIVLNYIAEYNKSQLMIDFQTLLTNFEGRLNENDVREVVDRLEKNNT